LDRDSGVWIFRIWCWPGGSEQTSGSRTPIYGRKDSLNRSET